MRILLSFCAVLMVAAGSFGVGYVGGKLAKPFVVELSAGPVQLEVKGGRTGLFGAMAVPPVPPRDVVYKLPENELAPHQVIVERLAPKDADTADWGHKNIGVVDAWKTTKGKGAVVAVLDTGIDDEHRDLKTQIKAQKDFTGSRSGSADIQGHGTHCAGVVAAAENKVGMVGVAPECQLLIGKVLDDRGSGRSTWIANGIDWAVAEGADVISMSLGADSPDAIIEAAVKRAVARDVIVVAAAGNDGPRDGTIGFPGGYPEVICVGATDRQDRVAEFSSRGGRLDVAAPGVSVRSCYPGDRFATMSGTSMATPHVAGVAALYVADCKSRGAKPTPDGFRALVTAQAKDLPPSGRDNATGFGLVQPAKMLTGALPLPDHIELLIPPEHRGRPIKRIVIEFEPVPARKGA